MYNLINPILLFVIAFSSNIFAAEPRPATREEIAVILQSDNPLNGLTREQIQMGLAEMKDRLIQLNKDLVNEVGRQDGRISCKISKAALTAAGVATVTWVAAFVTIASEPSWSKNLLARFALIDRNAVPVVNGIAFVGIAGLIVGLGAEAILWMTPGEKEELITKIHKLTYKIETVELALAV